MARKEDQRTQVEERLSRHLLETGLARTSLRELAAAAGVSDRMLLYYFQDKSEVLSAAVALVARRLAKALAGAIPAETRLPPALLAHRAAEVTTQPELRPFMRLWLEIAAGAARREEPYVTIAAQMMTGFRNWLEPHIALPEGGDRAAAALAVMAICDGLAMIEICAGAPAAEQARLALPLTTN